MANYKDIVGYASWSFEDLVDRIEELEEEVEELKDKVEELENNDQ